MLYVLIRIAFEAILISTLNIQLQCRRSIDFPELAIFASRQGAMINLQWLELPMARTIFYGPKGVRATEVRLCMYILLLSLEIFLRINTSHVDMRCKISELRRSRTQSPASSPTFDHSKTLCFVTVAFLGYLY